MPFPDPPPSPEHEPQPIEIDSAIDMLRIVRILAVIFGVIILITGLSFAASVSTTYNSCTSSGNLNCNSFTGIEELFVAFTVVACIINLVIFLVAGGIRDSIFDGDYEGAKHTLLVWTILGFILGGILIGIFLLVAYLKMDPLINWQRRETLPPWASRDPSPWADPPPPAAGPPLPPPPTDTPLCARCGKPTTYLPQYGRYYCYPDRLYAPRG